MRIIDEVRAPARLPRRTVITGGSAMAMLVFWPLRAHALTVAQANALVAAISADLDRLMNSGRSGAQLYGQFERILAQYADMSAVAASVLGPPWRGASSAQRTAYVAAFQGYLARKYGRQFGDFRNAEIHATGARDAGRAGILVKTAVVRPGRETVAVDWQISDRGGSAKAVNLVVEGVSMLATERAEVGAMLDANGGSLDGLIADMKQR
jgi:phospholipid transport system substrate-binding protein